MAKNDTNDGNCGRYWQRPRFWFMFGIPIGGFAMFLVGIIFWGGFNTVVHMTNSLGFCTSCHEMQTVYEEYKTSIHYKNEVGVRAICPDCHVPKEWGPMMVRKIQATFNELPMHVMNVIDSPEKFKSMRLELARDVWKAMKATDSRECRNCHSIEAMDIEKQGHSAQKKHNLARMKKRNETCIDCHKGIAHKLPEGFED